MALPKFASGVLLVGGNNWLLNNTNALQYKTKACLLNVVKKMLKIVITQKGVFTPSSAIHHMIKRIFILYS
jgi:hypothetical protein